jgi:hypothetical protein
MENHHDEAGHVLCVVSEAYLKVPYLNSVEADALFGVARAISVTIKMPGETLLHGADAADRERLVITASI